MERRHGKREKKREIPYRENGERKTKIMLINGE